MDICSQKQVMGWTDKEMFVYIYIFLLLLEEELFEKVGLMKALHRFSLNTAPSTS